MIDGRQWLQSRLHALESALEHDELDADERSRLQAEAVRLRDELERARPGRWLRGLGAGGVADACRAWRNRKA